MCGLCYSPRKMRKKTRWELLGLSPDYSRTDSGMESTCYCLPTVPGGYNTPLYKPHTYVLRLRYGFWAFLAWKRVYSLLILVWNRVCSRGKHGSVWMYYLFNTKSARTKKKYTNSKLIWRIVLLHRKQSKYWWHYASVNSSCDQPPPPGWPPGINIFFALDGKFPGVGTLQLSNPPGWGRKKRANAPSSVNTATFFINR